MIFCTDFLVAFLSSVRKKKTSKPLNNQGKTDFSTLPTPLNITTATIYFYFLFILFFY